MLNILEKLQYGLSVLVIVGSLGLYTFQGMAKVPSVFVPPMRKATPTKRAEASKKAGPSEPAAAQPKEDLDLIQRIIKEKGIPLAGKELVHDDRTVPRERVEYMVREANLQPELDKAKSQILPGADGRMTRLKVYDIDENSIIRQSGLESGDVIEYIDGKSIDFEKTSKAEFFRQWSQNKDKFLKGGTVSLTITRKGVPVQLSFRPE